jgi:hypothetical protein
LGEGMLRQFQRYCHHRSTCFLGKQSVVYHFKSYSTENLKKEKIQTHKVYVSLEKQLENYFQVAPTYEALSPIVSQTLGVPLEPSYRLLIGLAYSNRFLQNTIPLIQWCIRNFPIKDSIIPQDSSSQYAKPLLYCLRKRTNMLQHKKWMDIYLRQFFLSKSSFEVWMWLSTCHGIDFSSTDNYEQMVFRLINEYISRGHSRELAKLLTNGDIKIDSIVGDDFYFMFEQLFKWGQFELIWELYVFLYDEKHGQKPLKLDTLVVDQEKLEHDLSTTRKIRIIRIILAALVRLEKKEQAFEIYDSLTPSMKLVPDIRLFFKFGL